MADIVTVDTQELRDRVTGEVLGPGDAGYDEARTVWNGAFDRRPAVVVRPATAEDVAAALGFARSHGLEVAVRGGAHSTGGASVVDGGLQIDLGLLSDVTVDVAARRCRVGGGATLGDRDRATMAHGLATPGGLVSHTGVAGLTLGGGMGWLTRKHGLAIDNLVSAEVVTADGRVLQASAQENPDLFWAIRGGGGNFGVVTAFEFQLHPVAEMVQFGLFFWPLDKGREVLRLAREVVATLPAELNVVVAGVNAPPEPFVPEEHRLRPGYALLVTGFGAEAEHAALADRIRSELPPLFDLVTPMPYLALQQLLDEANAFGFLAYDKGAYLEDLSDAAIEVVLEHLPRKSSPRSVLLFYRLDGAYSEVADDATAFGGGRSPRYNAFVVALADNQEMYEADRAWVRSFWEALQPYALSDGGYLNAEAEPTDADVRSGYGPTKYARLAQIKAAYDPENLFHRNANITPAPQPAQPPQQRVAPGG